MEAVRDIFISSCQVTFGCKIGAPTTSRGAGDRFPAKLVVRQELNGKHFFYFAFGNRHVCRFIPSMADDEERLETPVPLFKRKRNIIAVLEKNGDRSGEEWSEKEQKINHGGRKKLRGPLPEVLRPYLRRTQASTNGTFLHHLSSPQA